jgi:hypothetical protein
MHSTVFRLVKIWFIGLVHRIKFYFVWTLSDANLTIAGFGFNGWKDKARREARWDRHTNGWPLEIEFASSTAKLMHVWNCKTGVFLRRCALLNLVVTALQKNSYFVRASGETRSCGGLQSSCELADRGGLVLQTCTRSCPLAHGLDSQRSSSPTA